ncbi:flagellin [Haloimpatiens lingqiaonensis]|uniref:flagellin N-terminal helical domain-containing protein n=1 Tax=Haloimpatiens lingqiaonensis TaxID=1380675 RepID=UPI0010FE2E58|nr:flagellin [Haloimpatiens lingqiaonensis]
MIINHNMNAMNAHRMMSGNTVAAGKSMEKLSSGLRINRAGDDAAGLAISEKMRGQIRGLDQASRNAQDGISLLQTAEGALNETHSILQRMRELSVQSSTDTNTADDRAKIQSEVDELAKEITRISNTTEFNTQNLMAGGLKDTFHIGANKNQNITISINAMDAKALSVSGDMEVYSVDATNAAGIGSVENPSDNLDGYKITTVAKSAATAGTAITGAAVSQSNALGGALAGTAGDYNGSQDATIMVRIDSTATVGGKEQVAGASISLDGGKSYQSVTVTQGANSTFQYAGMTLGIAEDAENANGNTYTFQVAAEYKQVKLQDSASADVGATAKIYNNQTSAVIGSTDKNIKINFDYATLDGTGTKTSTLDRNVTASTKATFGADGSIVSQAVTYKGIDVSTQKNANKAIETINKAITTVSEERSKLGAYQNRLEHTIANLGTSSENLQSAESRVRDVDMAKEMMNFSKNNILSQAAQAMLAQANNQPQGVLQLLR